MEIIQEPDFRKALKSSGGAKGAYLFFGEEDYMKLADLKALRAAVCPDDGLVFFNDIRIDATDFTPDALLDALMPMPMMSDRKLVTVNGLDLNTIKKDTLDGLCGILSELPSYDYNTLVIICPDGLLDPGIIPTPANPRARYKPSAVFSALSEVISPVYFPRNTPVKLASWIQRHFASDKISITPEVCRYFITYCGTDMFRLSTEIDKLTAYLHASRRDNVTPEDIRTVSVRELEYGAFDFSNALMAGNRSAAMDILRDLSFRREEPTRVLSEVSGVFCDSLVIRSLADSGLSADTIADTMGWRRERVSVYLRSVMPVARERLEHAVLLCADADRAVKLSGRDYMPLEKLICSI